MSHKTQYRNALPRSKILVGIFVVLFFLIYGSITSFANTIYVKPGSNYEKNISGDGRTSSAFRIHFYDETNAKKIKSITFRREGGFSTTIYPGGCASINLEYYVQHINSTNQIHAYMDGYMVINNVTGTVNLEIEKPYSEPYNLTVIACTCPDSAKKSGGAQRTTATCTTPATYYYICGQCGEQRTDYYNSGSALGHDYTSKTQTSTYLKSNATCTSAATYFYKCSRCTAKGTNYYSSGSSLGHNFAAKDTSSTYLRSNATCTEAATYFYKCSRCSEKGTNYYSSGNALGHEKPSSWSGNDAANHYKNCTKCGARLETVPHTVQSDWSIDSSNHYKNCISCGRRLETVPHSIQAEWSFDEQNHYKNCTVCNYRMQTIPHTRQNTWSSDDQNHYKNCTECGKRMETVPHTAPINWSYDDSTHYKNCIICNHRLQTENHERPKDWNASDNAGHYRRCTKCNAVLEAEAHIIPDDWDENDGTTLYKHCKACHEIVETKNYNEDIELAIGEVNNLVEVNATNKVTLYPDLRADGNTTNYTIKWLESKDEGKTWNVVQTTKKNGITVDKAKEELQYSFTADCSQTFNLYKYYLTNEAGTVTSGETTLLVYEKFTLTNKTLTITTTGYLEGQKTGNYPMNNYNDPRWEGRIPLWRNNAYETLVINDHITTIGAETFKDSSELEHVKINSKSMESVGISAFEDSGLYGIILPETVNTIQKDAFKNCNRMRDIWILNKSAVISEEIGTIPGSSDEGIEGYDRNTDIYKRKHGFPVIYGYSGSTTEAYVNKFNSGIDLSYNFMPVNDSTGTRIEWNYTVDEAEDTLDNLYTNTSVSGTVRVPKSIDGYLVIELGNIEVSENGRKVKKTLLGKEISEDENGIVCEENTTLKVLMIPDSVMTIGYGVLVNTPNVTEIYNEAYDAQDFEYEKIVDGEKQIVSSTKYAFYNVGKATADNPDDENETSAGTIYFYSTNYEMNETMPSTFERVLYDKDLNGIYKGVSYTVNLKNKKLEIETYRGATTKETPFDWARNFVKEIVINPDTDKLEDELFKDFTLVYTITNNSNSLTHVAQTAFENVGANADDTKSKTCTTYVSNELYDAVKAIGGFDIIFKDTTRYCGTLTTNTYPVSFEFKVGSGSLTLSPYNTGTVSIMDEYTEQTIPWRCVKDKIRSVEIQENVKNISTNAFTGLYDLQEVYNRSYEQTVSGEIFDVIERYQAKDSYDDKYMVNIDDPTDYPAILAILASKGFDTITEDELRAITIPKGRHYIYPYMLKEEVLEELQVNYKHIVPVYCILDRNQAFVDKVPQPEEKGYRLESLFLANGKCGDNAYWSISKDGTLSITGFGAVYDYREDGFNYDVPWKNYRDKIYNVSIADKITHIGAYSFAKLTNVESVKLPASVTSIGIEAFMESGLTTFELTENLSKIEGALFTDCKNLRTITGSDNHYKVVDGILYSKDDTVLVEYLRDQIYKTDPFEPYKELVSFDIPETVKTIANRAFYKNKSLNRMMIPANVKKIESHALAQMEKLYFVDAKSEEPVDVNMNALFESALDYSTKEVLLYMDNADMIKAAQNADYRIRYYDNMMIDHINASYAGDPVVIGQAIPLDKVVFDIVFASGLSETVTGNDIRFMINDSMTVTKVGDNVFNATYDDGYTEPCQTGDFIVPGVNRIVEMAAKYTGLDVWYGEKFNKSNVILTLKYANGDIKTLVGTNEYVTYDKQVIQALDKTIVDGVEILGRTGKETVRVTYDDKQNKVFTSTIEIGCSDYIDEIQAEYLGTAKVEATAGTSGLTDDIKKNINVKLKWKSSENIETKTGLDGSVSFSGGTDMVGEYLQFLVTYNKLNRYNKSAVINLPCASNIRDVMFTYVGTAVTKGTAINLSNILITVYYKDNTQRNFKADTVGDTVTLNPSIINNYGDNPINITYNPPGYSKSDILHIQGTIASPVKLIIVERPKKTVYQKGETFDPEGLRVNCLYDNGEIADVSDDIVIETPTITEGMKNVVLSYTETRSGAERTVKTYLSINVNQNQKELTRDMTFKESYEIERILFRSKKTEDVSGSNQSEEATEAKWTEIEVNDTSKGENTDLSASIKAGYGFEMKVYTRYKTTRGNDEFKAFMEKSAWDAEYQTQLGSVSEYIDHVDEWAYLNDIYPQHVPTANPDMLYVRIVKRSAGSPDRYTQIGENDFVVMEKTNRDELNRLISEGEWYNSQKIFEFPLRTVDENGNIIHTDDENGGDRRLYVSRNAAQSDAANTEYIIQIISPAWYGYESEPEYDSTNGRFIHNEIDEEIGVVKDWYGGPSDRFLHVVYEFSLFVQKNDDVHTHILQ